MKICNNIIFVFMLVFMINLSSLNLSILGIGRLGICTALCFEQAGFNVLGLDLSPSYIDDINNKALKSPEPYVNEYLAKSKNLKATTSLDEALNFSDIYFIVVPTPSGAYEAYDHSILSSLLIEINKRKIKNKHVVICCTVFPGYIKEIGDILEEIYKKTCKNTPKICRMSPPSAEITKLAINCFVTTKIAFANSIGDAADLTEGANKVDILNAVGSDSRVGNKYLMPGYGFGGPCFPRDNRALGSYIKLIGLNPLLQKTTDNLNKMHAEFMASHLNKRALDEYIFEDVNYKDNCKVVIIEESQKLAVAEILAKQGKSVTIKDKLNVVNEVRKKYGNLFNYLVV